MVSPQIVTTDRVLTYQHGCLMNESHSMIRKFPLSSIAGRRVSTRPRFESFRRPECDSIRIARSCFNGQRHAPSMYPYIFPDAPFPKRGFLQVFIGSVF